MEILPVVDLLGGAVVRGVAGRRNEYRPVESLLCRGSAPIDVARALHAALGLSRFYLADLDAILGREPALELFRRLADDGFDLLLDAGLRCAADARPLMDAGATVVVAGLETLASPAELRGLTTKWGADRVLFSLDLKKGRPLVGGQGWSSTEPTGVLDQAVGEGVRQVLLLDLARVGIGEGLGTESLLAAALTAHPDLRFYVGGGVSGIDDLHRIQEAGAAGVLIASALHDGRLTRQALGEFAEPQGLGARSEREEKLDRSAAKGPAGS
jgi:phosphoribosylformimino-5-aminoimidazole carboxamide ribotide isomerase